MPSHRKANSDFPEELTLKKSRTFSFHSGNDTLDTRQMFSQRQIQHKTSRTNCPETSRKQDAQEVVISVYKLIRHFFKDEEPAYFARAKKYLSGEWQGHRKNLNEHLNKIGFLEAGMQKKKYNEIELEIVIEWRKCQILYCLRAFWYQQISTTNFTSIGDFLKKYNRFKEFTGQLAYYYFKNFFFHTGSENQEGQLLDRLTQRTSHMIITYTSTWSKICDQTVTPLLKIKMAVGSNPCYDMSGLSMGQLKIKTVYVSGGVQQNQLSWTTYAIEKFIKEPKLLQKIRLLIDVRKTLEAQILRKQQKMIEAKQIEKADIVEKDDFIDCLVYCIFKGEISLENLGASIKFFYYVLGSDAGNLLSKFRCDCYLADLETAYEYLMMKIREVKEKQQDRPEQVTIQARIFQ